MTDHKPLVVQNMEFQLWQWHVFVHHIILLGVAIIMLFVAWAPLGAFSLEVEDKVVIADSYN